MIYLICFGTSLALLKLRVPKNVKKITVFAALLLPCLLAGFRANSVGSDTGDYPLTMYNLALNNSYFNYMNTSFMHMWVQDYVRDMGIGYASFVYFIARIFQNYGILLFFTQVVIVFSVYGAVKKKCGEQDAWIGMFVFYLLFYNVSLNAVRQWMAMAILLLAYAEFLNHKKRWFPLAVLGTFFHSTAVCGLLVFILYFIMEKVRLPKMRFSFFQKANGNWLLIVAMILTGMYLLSHLEVVRHIIGITSLAHFLNYFDGTIDLSVKRILLELPLPVLCLLNWKYFKDNENKQFILLFSILNLMLSQLNTINVLAWRISAYVSMFTVLYYPTCIQVCKNRGKKILQTSLLGMYGLLYWLYYFAILNAHSTLPYLLR